MRESGRENIQTEIHPNIKPRTARLRPQTGKKISAANQPDRSSQEHDSAFYPHALDAARSMNSHRRLNLPERYGRQSRCARPCARRLRLSRAALEKTSPHIMPSIDRNHLNIHPAPECRIALDLGRLPLPVLGKLLYEHYVVRIPHRNRNPPHLLPMNSHREFGPHHRLAHFNLELIVELAARCQHASLQAGPSLDRDSLFLPFRANVRRHTARAIARNLRLRTIGVYQANLSICRGMRIYPFHSVRANAFMAVAYPARQG